MTLRACRLIALLGPFALAIYLTGIWVSCLAQTKSDMQLHFEHDVAAAIKIEDMTSDINVLKAAISDIRAMNLEVRLTRIEDAAKRNEASANQTQRMLSAMLISFVGFMIQQGAKLFLERRTRRPNVE